MVVIVVITAVVVLVVLVMMVECLVLGAFGAAVVGKSCARGAWLDLD